MLGALARIGGVASKVGQGAGRVAMAPVRGARGLLSGATKAGGAYAIGNALFGGNEENQNAVGSDGGGDNLAYGGGMGGVSASPVSTAAAATSALSDADSSDPVVRQLQDIERVLVSIKGDTSQFASGLARAVQPAPNKEALRNMFGRSGGSIGPAGAAGLGLAGLFALGVADKLGGDNDKGDTEAGTQERFDNIIGNEVEDLAMTAGPKLAGVAGQKIGAQIGETITERGTRAAARAVAESKVQTSTGGSRVQPDGRVVNPDGKELKGASANSVKQNIEKTRKAVEKAALESGEVVAGRATKIGAAIAANAGKFIGKGVPLLGTGMNLVFAAEKLLDGDYTGAGLEALSMFLPSVSGSGVDLVSFTRDVYKDVYDKFPEEEENMDIVQARLAEITAMAGEYLASLGESDSEPVPARPEVTARGGHAKRNQLNAQRAWDEKYGDTYNPDGTMINPPEPTSETSDASQIESSESNASSIIDAATDTAGEMIDGLSNVVPLNAAVEVDAATESQSEIETGKNDAMMAAISGMQASSPAMPYQPEVAVHVNAPKTSFPQANSELEFLKGNQSFFT